MATTIEIGAENTFQNDLANTLISKLDIDSKFLNEVVDRALTIASKNVRVDTEKLKKEKQTKEPTKPKESKVDKTNTLNTPKQNLQSQPLNVTNNTFEITDTSKQETKLVDTVTKSSNKQETILDRFLKTIEKTTNSLEKTVKKVPRPWELTPGTSIGYQMLAGEDEVVTERIRKGLAQFIGRYATNIKAPYGYDSFGFEVTNREFDQKLDKPVLIPLIKDTLKTVIKDLGPKLLGGTVQEYGPARDILYREMFDLPPRTTTDELQKIKPKEYTLTKESSTKPFKITKQLDKAAIADHSILGGAYLTETPDKKNYQYRDVWDIVSSFEKDEKFESLMKESPIQALLQSIQKLKENDTSQIRKLIAPLLRPATVSGLISKEGMPIKNNINLSKNLTDEVSTKLEKMPVLDSLTKGLKSIENNKLVDGLKEISSIAPSVKPIISLLTAKQEPLKVVETTDLVDMSKPFNQLKDKMKESTLTKVTTWTDNLYSWSKNKIVNFTESLERTFNETKNFETKPLTDFKLPKIKNTQTIDNLYNNITPEITSALNNFIDKDNLSINNKTLDKIASNTQNTNNAIKVLGDAILKLAQTLNTGSKKSNNIIIPPQTSNTSQQQYTPTSFIAAANQDPIAAVRSQFIYSTG